MPLFKYLYGINTKRLKSESLNSSYLWHGCLGHISDKCVRKLHKFGNLRSFDHMKHRILSERQRIRYLHSNKKGEHATETLVMIHLDVCEPMSYM